MDVIASPLPGVLIVIPKRFADARGRFEELYHAQRYARAGIDHAFVQDNLSVSRRGVLRGLHFQHPQGQGKLVTIAQGAVFDVAVDIRRGSPSFGRWFGTELSADNGRQLWIPPGFAHGFCVLTDSALCHYKCTAFYDPACEAILRWDDPQLAIDWPVAQPILSGKDAAAPMLAQIDPRWLPEYRGAAP